MLSLLLATVINGHATVQLRAPDSFAANATNEIAIEFKIKPDWHIYWENPGDSGEEPRATWKVEPMSAATVGALEYPIPKRLPSGPFTNFGFESDPKPVVFRVPVKVGATGSGAIDLTLNLTYLVCQEACVPEKAELKLSVPVSASGAARLNFNDGDFPKRIGVGSKSEPHRGTFSVAPSVAGERMSFSTEGSALAIPADFEFFPLTPQALTAKDKGERSESIGEVSFRKFDVAIDASLAAKDMPPKILGLVVDVKKPSAEWIEFVAKKDFSFIGFVTSIGLAFLGGLLLNLMPCVFPVVSLKVLSFVREGAGDAKEVRRHAYAYVAGILISLWALVGILLLVRAAGVSVGWGFQLQNPIFLFTLLGVFFVLGLNLLGLFDFNYQGPAVLQNLMMKRGLGGSFFTGLLTTVVATPCSAPFMGVAVGSALAGGPAEAFSIFTSLALGLAFPYVVLALNPVWISRLPKPGAWMEKLKEFLAFPLLLTAVWLFWVLSQVVDSAALVLILVWCVAAGFLAWSLRVRSYILRATAILFLIGTSFVAVTALQASGVDADSTSDAAKSVASWQPYSDARLQAELAKGNSVFVDFTASWCVTCQVNKKLVLLTERTNSIFEAASVVRLRADWTKRDAEITNALARLGRNSVPVYAFYRKGTAQAAGGPELLPEILTLDILKNALEKK